MEPWQVKPLVPPQVPSVETLAPAEADGAAELATVDEAALEELTTGVLETPTEEELTTGVLEAPTEEELTTPLPPQLPNEAWQPVPQ